MDNKNPHNVLSAYLDTLTDEEKETYKALIEECIERDKRITRDAETLRKSINRLAKAEEGVLESLKLLDSSLNTIIDHVTCSYLHLSDHKKIGQS